MITADRWFQAHCGNRISLSAAADTDYQQCRDDAALALAGTDIKLWRNTWRKSATVPVSDDWWRMTESRTSGTSCFPAWQRVPFQKREGGSRFLHCGESIELGGRLIAIFFFCSVVAEYEATDLHTHSFCWLQSSVNYYYTTITFFAAGATLQCDKCDSVFGSTATTRWQ